MRFAVNENNERIEVSKSRQIAKCPGCDSVVIGKFGSIKKKHWSHKIKDCDNWYEPLTDWHLNWQNKYPLEYQEVPLKDLELNINHRADIRLNNGLVIEIQNSPIKIEEIKEREDFYGKKGLIWILNGEKLTTQSELTYLLNPKRIEFEVCIPDVLSEIYFYDISDFTERFSKTKTIKLLLKSQFLKKFEIFQGYRFNFQFSQNLNFELIEEHILYETSQICKDLILDFDEVKKEMFFEKIIMPNDYFSHIFLTKKNWRKFIDKMQYPVFIDNLKGMKTKYLYWLQENKIVDKEKFIDKYRKYT